MVQPRPILPTGMIAVLLVTLVCGFVAYAQDNNTRSEFFTPHTPLALTRGEAKMVGPYDRNQTLRLVFGLQPPHLAEEEQFLHDVQTKDSPVFHHYLTAEQWNSRFAPRIQDERSVVEWIQQQGLSVTHRYPNRLLVDVEAPVSKIETALQVKVNSYLRDSMPFFSNDRDPVIPARFAGIIHSITGLNNLEVARPHNGSQSTHEFPVYAPGPVVGAPVSRTSSSEHTLSTSPHNGLAACGNSPENT